jgi:hypothetical protein
MNLTKNWQNKSDFWERMLTRPLNKSRGPITISMTNMMLNWGQSRMFARNTSQNMRSIWSIIRPSSRISKDSKSNGSTCWSNLRNLIKLGSMRLRPELRRMRVSRWKNSTLSRRQSRNLFMLWNNNKSQQLNKINLLWRSEKVLRLRSFPTWSTKLVSQSLALFMVEASQSLLVIKLASSVKTLMKQHMPLRTTKLDPSLHLQEVNLPTWHQRCPLPTKFSSLRDSCI